VEAQPRVFLEVAFMMPSFGSHQHLFIFLAIQSSMLAVRRSGLPASQSCLRLLPRTRGNPAWTAQVSSSPSSRYNWGQEAILSFISSSSPFFEKLIKNH
tara:strand:- start:271 stop:567 length:297 start_codon:yes stop_codon:yes gene_type:complete